MRVLVVDDEPPARRRLVRLVEALGFQVVGEAGDGEAALAAIERFARDVVLLDISMPGLDGLEVAARTGVAIVFTTAHPEHAVAAFEVEAVDYLLKPVARERLEAALSRTQRQRRTVRLTARHGDTARVFDVKQVARFTARDKYTVCEIDGEELLLEESLSALEERLAPLGFVRVHRAELVDLGRVVRTTRDGGALVLELDDGTCARVSRRATQAVRERLGGIIDG